MPTMNQCISVTSAPRTSPLTVLSTHIPCQLHVFLFLNLSNRVIQSVLSVVKV